jgi:hypothetical protein
MKDIARDGSIRYLNPNPSEVINSDGEGSLWYKSREQSFPVVLWASGTLALNDPNDQCHYILYPDGMKKMRSYPTSGTHGGR